MAYRLLFRNYHFKEVETKWQQIWRNNPIQKRKGQKFYCLSMFPYPSGNLHIGHVRVYAISEAFALFEHLKGKNVLHPMGWDAFGLPAENAAKEKNIEPHIWTFQNTFQMRRQMDSLGLRFDWDRELWTCMPDYYRWTQWLFILLFKKGLAYKTEGYLNWDPIDKTVLANEQVDENGRAWRSGALVERKPMKQWYFKITEYADELLKGLDKLQWPDQVKEMQRGWIGKTNGFVIEFQVNETDENLSAFTKKIEGVLGTTCILVSPEHPILAKLNLSPEEKQFLEMIRKKPETTRKIGNQIIVISNHKAINPVTNEEIPIAIAEYVLMTKGTGCKMGIPAHDDKDLKAVEGSSIAVKKVFDNDQLINCGEFTGLSISEAIPRLKEILKSKDAISPKSVYNLRDWLVSRQRYWGVPIPMINCIIHGYVPNYRLPVMLPQKGEDLTEWRTERCPYCGTPGGKEIDTLDTFVDSSWYYLRYVDPRNDFDIFDREEAKKLLPVDLYIGGTEHAIMHLLYARFIHKVLRDEGYLADAEPFANLLTQGLVLGKTYKKDGKYITAEEAANLEGVEISHEKMSKSKKNGINPLEIIEEWGADVLRLAILFAAPSESQIEWDGGLLKTMKKWLEKIWSIVEGELAENDEEDYSKLLNGVTRSFDNKKLHVVIARLMEYTEVVKAKPTKQNLKILLITLHPFAPHFTAEAYTKIFNKDITNENWPTQIPTTKKTNLK